MKLREAHLLDNRENPGLRIIVPICSDSLAVKRSATVTQPPRDRWTREAIATYQINLVRALIGLVGPHQPEKRILGCLRDRIGGEAR